MNTNRRNISPEFHAAVVEGLKAINSKQCPDHVAKVLYTNSMIEVKEGKVWALRENPHYLGRNVETIVETIKGWRK